MEHNLKTIDTFKQAHRAHILEALLEEQNIESFLSEETVFGAIDGVKVQVDEPNYEKAMSIFNAMEKEQES